MLGVEEFGLAGAVAEEALVEQVGTVQHTLGPDVVVVGQERGVDAGGGEFLLGQDSDAFAALGEVGPEGLHVIRTGEAADHADHGDAIEALVPVLVLLLVLLHL